MEGGERDASLAPYCLNGHRLDISSQEKHFETIGKIGSQSSIL